MWKLIIIWLLWVTLVLESEFNENLRCFILLSWLIIFNLFIAGLVPDSSIGHRRAKKGTRPGDQ
jgi:hypothetical protein